jgi:hypothetical protein
VAEEPKGALGAFLADDRYNDFRKALVRIVIDQDYVEATKSDPKKISRDYHLSDEELGLLEDVVDRAVPAEVVGHDIIALHSVVVWEPLFPGDPHEG